MSQESIAKKALELQQSQIDDVFHSLCGTPEGEDIKITEKDTDRAVADKALYTKIAKVDDGLQLNSDIGETLANGQDEQRIRRDLQIGLASRRDLILSALKILKMKKDVLDKELKEWPE